MYFYGYFLINVFIPPRRAEVITREKVVPAKRNPGCIKEGSGLAGIKRIKCNRRM